MTGDLFVAYEEHATVARGIAAIERDVPSGAVIASRFRHLLWRQWDPGRALLGWVMCNPSTANARDDDTTIRKCVGFARRWDYGGIVVANLFAYRATDWRDLRFNRRWPPRTAPRPAAGRRSYVLGCPRVVAAWGLPGRSIDAVRAAEVERRMQQHPEAYCLGRCADGSPRHPLMLPYETEAVRL